MQKVQTKLKDLLEKVKGFFTKLNKKVRILLAVCAAVVLVLIIAAAVLLNRKEYALLYAGLTSSETSTVVSYLSEKGITDYRISGDKIFVPAGREIQLQAELAMSGYRTTGFNYEFYTGNTSQFSTEAERREAIRIATQDRLAAVIRQFEGVRDATVDITLGTKRVYVIQDSATPSKAAVTITPDGNRQLSNGVVDAIRHTVSHSVEELNIESVSIVDTYGNNYNSGNTIDDMSEANALKAQYEEQLNNNIRTQILQTLGAIYGESNVRVGVSSTVDVNRKIIESTEYRQPPGAVEGAGLINSEHIFWEYIRDGSEPVGGTVGTQTNSDINTYPDRQPNLTGDENYAGRQDDKDYSLDTTKQQTEVLAGTITDIRVTVAVNQNCANANAMSVEELNEHVSVAAGLGEEEAVGRVDVRIAPFDAPIVTPRDGFWLSADSWVLYAAIAGLVLFLILLLVIILLMRRSKKKKLARQKALEEEMMAAAAEAEAAAIIAAAPPTGGADIMEVNTEKSMELRKTVRQFAQNNPEIAAQMVKAWLKGEDTSG